MTDAHSALSNYPIQIGDDIVTMIRERRINRGHGNKSHFPIGSAGRINTIKISMKIFQLTLFILAMISTAASGQTTNTAPLVSGNTTFAVDLYSRLRTNEGNLFFSPYSISTCLAMTHAGARGETEMQMAKTLHFGTDQSSVHSAFGNLQEQLNEAQKKKEIELNVANALWAQKGHPFLPAFMDIAKQRYEANVQQVDFRRNAEPTAREINEWVSNKTKGKITNLIQPGVLNGSTRLVLVNAIYFKGKWAQPFKPSNTKDAPFSITPGQQVQTPLMNLTASFKYAETDGMQLLELPYMGNDISMVVLLPKEVDGLKALESSLSQEKLNAWLAQGRQQRTSVFLPKFKLTSQFDLVKTLSDLGMPSAFSTSADFSGMDGARDLFLSAVVHKAFVDVNEEGTEAAAATGAVMAMTSAQPRPIPVFRADHPFLFLIRDTHSGSILFIGRLVDPTK
ncbi:MAG: proteinase inhibitor serpin [Pedosphaera sp.]|nr:proteinase inhibitor serpin [Pedosphaera sp.]